MNPDLPILNFKNNKIILKNHKITTATQCCCCGASSYEVLPSGACCGGTFKNNSEKDNFVCCGGSWYEKNDGVCCNDRWYPNDNPCPSGLIYLEWGTNKQCCGCVPEKIPDPRVPNWGQPENWVDIVSVQSDLCCPCFFVSDGYADFFGMYRKLLPIFTLPFLPYDYNGQYRGCYGSCCGGDPAIAGENPDGSIILNYGCKDVRQYDCYFHNGDWYPGCCWEHSCPVKCCYEDSDGNSHCETLQYFDCMMLQNSRVVEDCETDCVGQCCKLVLTEIDGEQVETVEPQDLMTQQQCLEMGGEWQGLGTVDCSQCACRQPFSCSCCETKSSKAAGLTFTQPRNKRNPPFSDTFLVNVSGTTKSPIWVHGIPIDGGEEKCCPHDFNVSFLLCWDEFFIEPMPPCGSSFKDLNVTVCWTQQHTNSEILNFSGCDNLTINLSDCKYGCETTLDYNQNVSKISNSVIYTRGNATISSNGAGAINLTSDITPIFQLTSDNQLCGDRLLTLSGNSMANNKISGGILNLDNNIDSNGNAVECVNVRKIGYGTWWLNSNLNAFGRTSKVGLIIRDGTLVIVDGFFSYSNFKGPTGRGQTLIGGGDHDSPVTLAYYHVVGAYPPINTIYTKNKDTIIFTNYDGLDSRMTSSTDINTLSGTNNIVFQSLTNTKFIVEANIITGDYFSSYGGPVLPPIKVDDEPPTPYINNPKLIFGTINNNGTIISKIYTPQESPVFIRNGTVIIGADPDNPNDKSFSETIFQFATVTIGSENSDEQPNGQAILFINTAKDFYDPWSATYGSSEPNQQLYDIRFIGANNEIKNGKIIITAISSYPTFFPNRTPPAKITVKGYGQKISSNIELKSTLEIDTIINSALTISGDISAPSSGNFNIIKKGEGTLTLSGTNAYDGATTINKGALVISGGDAIPDQSRVDITDADSSLIISDGETIGSLEGIGKVVINFSALRIGLDNTDSTFSGTISGGGDVIKVGSGTLTLSGNNHYYGTTTIDSGTLNANHISALGSGNNIVMSSGILNLNNSIIKETLSINGSSTINIASTQSLQVDNLNGLGGPLTKLGNGELIVNHKCTMVGELEIQGGSININEIINGAPKIGSFTFTPNTLTINFISEPNCGDVYILMNAPTYSWNGSIVLNGTDKTGTYNKNNSTLTMDSC